MARTAAIVILAVLAHALLMTADAGAVGHHSASGATGTGVRDLPPPDAGRELPCFTIVSAAKSAPPTVRADGAVVAIPNNAPEELPPLPVDRTPPHHPPETIRALLQVYRI